MDVYVTDRSSSASEVASRPGLLFPGRLFDGRRPGNRFDSRALMRPFGPKAVYVATHPRAFALRVLRAFRANQGLLLAGAVAYYTLLSMVPLLILILIALSQVIDQAELLATLGRYLEWLIPGQSKAVIGELANFLTYHGAMGWVLLATMLFFSSLAFTVLENAMSVIYLHRVAIRRRHFVVSAVIPYCYIVFLGLGLLFMTLVSSSLQLIGAESIDFLDRSWSLRGVSGALIYFLGATSEVLVITSIYLVMRVGRSSLRHALIGGVTATVLWEITRHVLLWYFGSLSQVGVVYGSLATSIVLLLSLEIGATLLLLGAQVIAEYENIGIDGPDDAAAPADRLDSDVNDCALLMPRPGPDAQLAASISMSSSSGIRQWESVRALT